MVGAKCTLLARMDAYGQEPSGQAGEAMKVLVPVLVCNSDLLLSYGVFGFRCSFSDI